MVFQRALVYSTDAYGGREGSANVGQSAGSIGRGRAAKSFRPIGPPSYNWREIFEKWWNTPRGTRSERKWEWLLMVGI